MASPEILASRRQEYLRQPFLGQPMNTRTLQEVKSVIGKDARLIGEGNAQKLIFSTTGTDPFTNEQVSSVTTYNNNGFIESIRSSREGHPTTLVEFSYRVYEGPQAQASNESRYEVAQTQTYLETEGTRRKPMQREPIERANFAWVEEEDASGQKRKMLERSFKSYEGSPLKDRLDEAAYKGMPGYGSAQTNAETVITQARELGAIHPSYKVIDGQNGNTVVEVLMPSKSELSISPVRNFVIRKTFDQQGVITQVEMLSQPLRPDIDPIRSDVITYSYDDGYMTSVSQKNSQSTDSQFYAFSHKRNLVGPTGPVVVVDELKGGSGADIQTAQMSTIVSLDMLTHNRDIDLEAQTYLGFVGSQMTDETLPDGTLIRHIKASTLPQGQELRIENPGPNGQLSVGLISQN
ncbi:MAG TPA: hypothetical protein VFQ63_01585 [Patescibacteria group bacterium]|nr:hypothetical protein [Patescibacteria group bacterium]